FSSDPPHRPLHSFPTRRSSDLSCTHESSELTDAAADILRASAHRDSPHAQPNGRALGLYHALRSLGSADPPAGRGNGLGRWVFGDRKSTRLNSSHLVISYAVFC